MSGWRVEVLRATAAEIHATPLPEPGVPTMWVCEPTAPALVLGSAQGRRLRADGWSPSPEVEVVVRRSGGAAVVVVPGACTWVDLVLPAGHPLWHDDVGRAGHWVGELWVRALARIGVDASVHREGMVRSRWSSLVCFAGIGPGEVLDRAGAKLVGISQRRTRGGARFQTVAHHHEPADIVPLLGLGEADRADLAAFLTASTGAVGADAGELVEALVAELPA